MTKFSTDQHRGRHGSPPSGIHAVSRNASIALALSGACVAGENGALLGFPQGPAFNDAVVLVWSTIAAIVRNLVRSQLEKHSPWSLPLLTKKLQGEML